MRHVSDIHSLTKFDKVSKTQINKSDGQNFSFALQSSHVLIQNLPNPPFTVRGRQKPHSIKKKIKKRERKIQINKRIPISPFLYLYFNLSIYLCGLVRFLIEAMDHQNAVKEALNALYHHPQDEVRSKADEYLQGIQRSIDAWQVLYASRDSNFNALLID